MRLHLVDWSEICRAQFLRVGDFCLQLGVLSLADDLCQGQSHWSTFHPLECLLQLRLEVQRQLGWPQMLLVWLGLFIRHVIGRIPEVPGACTIFSLWRVHFLCKVLLLTIGLLFFFDPNVFIIVDLLYSRDLIH